MCRLTIFCLFKITFFLDIVNLLALPKVAAEQSKAVEHCLDECPVGSSKALLQASSPKSRRIGAPTEELAEPSPATRKASETELSPGELLKEAVFMQAATGSGGAMIATIQALRSLSKSANQHWHGWKQRKEAPKEVFLSEDFEGEKRAEQASAHSMLLMVFVGLTLGVAIYIMLRNREVILMLMQRLNLVPDKGDAFEKTTAEVVRAPQVLTPLEDHYFCPDLVVPAGCECILLVPTKLKGSETQHITDSNGSIVLSVTASDTGPSVRRKLVAGSNVTLPECGRARSSLPGNTLSVIEFELISASGEVWAQISYEPRQGAEDRCVITTKNEQQLHMVGSVRYNALNMTDVQGGLLATTEPVVEQGPLGEPPGSTCRLRVAPLADVGLVLCTLICLQHLSSTA